MQHPSRSTACLTTLHEPWGRGGDVLGQRGSSTLRRSARTVTLPGTSGLPDLLVDSTCQAAAAASCSAAFLVRPLPRPWTVPATTAAAVNVLAWGGPASSTV